MFPRAGLGATIIVAPLLAGGWRLDVLPIVGAAIVATYLGVLAKLRRRRRSLPWSPLAFGLLALAVFTCVQAVPWPGEVIATVSSKVAEVRGFTVGHPSGSISYEPGATWRETAKLLLYAIIVVVAAALVRTERDDAVGLLARPLAIAGLASVAIAVVHRLLGLQMLYGVFDTQRAAGPMWTTFLNQNHAAGFLNLSGAAAVAVACSQKHRVGRVGWILAAVALIAMSVAMGSKGGWGALAAASLIFIGAGLARSVAASRREGTKATEAVPVVWLVAGGAVVFAALALGVVILATPSTNLGIDEKLAAIRDVAGLLEEHPWLGIGRGAYVSVYTLYQTTDLQLTFAFPENIAVQLAAEWGSVVGPIALVGLAVVVIDRWWRVSSAAGQALLAGATAVVLQNFVDFSLELTGVAVPVAAILGATSTKPVSRGTLRVSRPSIFWPLAIVPVGALVICLTLAWRAGDLDRDFARIREHLDTPPTGDELTDIMNRHPASAVISAQIAFVNETSVPPNLRAALKAANRTLYLAPRYADGYLITGRLLVRAHQRNQGFEMLRQAWTLSSARRIPIITEIVGMADRPEELLLAVPRRNPALDVIDEIALTRGIIVAQTKRPEWMSALFAALPHPQDAPRESWPHVIRTAVQARQTQLGLAWAEHWRHSTATAENTLLLARLLMQADRVKEASALLNQHSGPVDESLLRLRFRLAIKSRDSKAGLEVLEELAGVLTPTRDHRAEVASLEAQLHIRAGELSAALGALNEALEHVPSRADIRLSRARLLLRLGRRAEAKRDVEYVLVRWPDNGQAKSLAATMSPP